MKKCDWVHFYNDNDDYAMTWQEIAEGNNLVISTNNNPVCFLRFKYFFHISKKKPA